METVTIVLPTYNEALTVVPLLDHIRSTVAALPYHFSVLVVDDNSPDGTAELVRSYPTNNQHFTVHCLLRTHDRGLGNSIREGMAAAQGAIVIGMDADGNHDPATLPLLLDGLQTADLVVASRFVRGGGMTDWRRYYPTRFINWTYQLLGMPIADNTSGYYALRKRDLMALGLDRIYYGYGDYHLRLVYYAARAGLRLREVPTFYSKRIGGTSKSSLWSMLVDYYREVWRLCVTDRSLITPGKRS